MTEMYGPGSAFLFVDGYDLTTWKVDQAEDSDIAIQEESHGIGDTWKERTPTGEREAEIVQGRAFFDTAAGRAHAALASGVPGVPSATERIVCIGHAGQTIGKPFSGFEGAFSSKYTVIANLGELQKANASYSVDGQRDPGEILQPLETKTADWNTESTPHDNAASSSNGAVGYLQVPEASGFTNFVGKIRDSSDDITYVDLITFDDDVSAPFAQRKTVAGNVDRYTAFDGNVTGTGSIKVFAGIARL